MERVLTILFFILLVPFTSLFSQTPWVELNTGISKRLNSISSIKDVSVWACGNEGTVIRSTNMGDNWTNANPNNDIPTSVTLNHIYCISPLAALAAGNDNTYAYVFKTVDGGSTWQVTLVQPGGRFNGIHMPLENSILIVGDPVGGRWSIWKSANGVNWDSSGCYLPQAGSEKGFPNSLWATGSRISFGTDNFRIYTTTNFSATWYNNSTGSERNSATLWYDYDYNIGYSGKTQLIKTVNSGVLWLNDTIPGSGDITSVTGSAHSRFNWFVRNDNKVYVNPHNASNWQLDYTTPSGNYTYITIERNGYFSGAVFATKDNGGISRTYFLSLGISQISSVVPDAFSLKQNYPNPFNPETKIRFNIPADNEGNRNISLNVYDIGGKLVKQLTNEKLVPGVYEVDFNASGLPSGVYFYRMNAGNFSDTRKMILLK